MQELKPAGQNSVIFGCCCGSAQWLAAQTTIVVIGQFYNSIPGGGHFSAIKQIFIIMDLHMEAVVMMVSM